MNDLYRDIIYNLARRAIADASSISGLLHAGTKGQLRELFVRQLLQPILPDKYIIGSGNIITAYNQVSNQIDVIVCDKRIVSPLLFQGDVGIFPVESVLSTIEVKSTLTLDELRKSHQSASLTNKFKHCTTPHPPIEHHVQAVFAFATDLSQNGRSEIDRYVELSASDDSGLKSICVVGRGCWIKTDEGWSDWTMPGIGGEIVAFLIATANTIQRRGLTRRAPDLRDYATFIHPGDPEKLCVDV